MILLHLDEQRGWRGGEQQASYLAQGLVERGHTVLIAGRKDGEFLRRHHDISGIIRAPLPFHGEWDVYTAVRLAGIVRQYRVDLIHAHTSHTHGLACIARRLARRGRVVATRRVDFPPNRNPWTRWKYRDADRVIAISGRIRTVLAEYGVPETKLELIYSAQDPDRLMVPPASRTELDVPEEARLVICPAALVGHKDHATLVAAMAHVCAQRPDVHLLLAGEGELRGAIEAQVRVLGLANHVHFLGYREDVPSLLRCADVFALSSKMEGLGSAIIEAMFCETPIVACAAGGIPELVRHEDTGLLVNPGDSRGFAEAVIRLLDSPELRTRLTTNAKCFAEEKCSAERMVEAYVRVYEDLLGKHAGA